MKKILSLLTIIIVVVIAGGCTQNPQNQNQQLSEEKQLNQEKQVNKQNCLQDDCLLVADVDYPVGELSDEIVEALNLALEDEYKAKTTYEAIIGKFGSTRPFIMIVRAEESHISSLKAVYDKYGLEIPENEWVGKITAPETLQEACATGVTAEIENARLYKEDLLPLVAEYPDIEGVFTNLMEASEQKHLPAFQKCD
jgi:hypothetical protein